VRLNDYKLLAVVAKEIEKMRQEQIAFVAASRADTFDEYKKVCGVIRGLSLAENIINDLVQKMEKSDD
jgi:hypothetical protein